MAYQTLRLFRERSFELSISLPPIVFVLLPDRVGRVQEYTAQNNIHKREENVGRDEAVNGANSKDHT